MIKCRGVAEMKITQKRGKMVNRLVESVGKSKVREKGRKVVDGVVEM